MRAFKRLLAAFGFVLLAACATGAGVVEDFSSLSPATQVYVLKDQFEAQLDTLRAYADQPACSATVVVGCHDPAVLDKLVVAAVNADIALDTAEAAVARGEPDSAAQVAAARQALNNLINQLAAREAR